MPDLAIEMMKHEVNRALSLKEDEQLKIAMLSGFSLATEFLIKTKGNPLVSPERFQEAIRQIAEERNYIPQRELDDRGLGQFG